MNVFYNEKGIGDVLMVTVQDIRRDAQVVEKNGDVVVILNKSNQEIAGINVFHASSYGAISGVSAIELDEGIKALLKEACDKNGVALEMEWEQKPAFVVGYVEEKEKHPNADKLSVCRVNIGTETLQIVCGAPNVAEGQKVVVALVGAVMPSGLVIKEATLRGVASSGMICSAKELGLENAPAEKGILVLSDDEVVGTPFLR
ncbi:tRNA-binding protein [Shouchella clausii]|uniref:YtpR family tRNA-binding protein n=1 Tax=Shouchella clausii TaxID=79880 RepID=UPI000BA544D4|nr:DUF4479 family protein [Shouchella clausii]MBU8597654.1 DUF4479 domain-containing protein [Shouchella clausii]MCY1105255.1 DUF4479 domain-containing protein [Shouchella clausii]MED4159519.1 DUF4479 domain-containing protein [Shouchella clausii]MED4177642.1 DUF4479 domain-containing protein [Shouchella clausii]PAD07635.1 tRNA-binding protein [Shouchella clausii]